MMTLAKKNFLKEFFTAIVKEKVHNKNELEVIKRKFFQKKVFPGNVELLKAYQKLVKEKRLKPSTKIEKLLKKRPVRSLSGIVNITVLTKPYPCFQKCVFCPTESDFPKSYLGGEPAAQRAKDLNFDPYLQVKKRIEMLRTEGHPTDKIELRIVGGTWSFYPLNYRIWFIKECFRAANEKFSYIKKSYKKNIECLWKELFREQKKNEKAKNRIVGISVETRADMIDKKEIICLRKLGVTMIEMGVQTLIEEIHQKSQTNLNLEKIAKATQLLKNNGFKVLYQMMLNLPGANFKKDLKSFKILYKDPRFKPDWLKIYPCLVIKNTKLYQLWKNKNYRPYSPKKLVKLLIEIKKITPHWIRITRIFRDIPSFKIEAGFKMLNLRQFLKKEMEKRNLFCACIRCREVKENYLPKEKIYLFRRDYKTLGGKEIFLTFENKKQKKLYSLLRLRIPEDKNNPFFPSLKSSALIREIKTFGELVPFTQKKLAPQHRGLGKKLLKEAEKIAKKEFKLNKMAVIAGIGAKNYFRKYGYILKNTYMIKKI